MLALDERLDVPATARYHPEAIEQVIQCVEERIYCALLGPRLCGKTLLLHFIEQDLAPLLGWTCVYVDLLNIRATTQGAFFIDLIRLISARLGELTGERFPLPEEGEASSAVFRAFLAECLERIGRDLVLIIDPLEALPTDLVQALLTSLRAAYMDQQAQDQQVTVVVSGALSLATLTVGESSPFRGIARRVFVGDLSEAESRAMILELLVENGLSATQPAVNKLLQATRGDVYLMRRISGRCAELVNSRADKCLRSRDIRLVMDRFLRQDVFQYAPLIDAIRLIEEDPDLLVCILRLLEQDSAPRAELPLPLSPDLDPLYLTGVVEEVDGDRYRVQNLIYRRFLNGYFTPGRVGHVLAMTGRWDAALDYLEASMAHGDRQSRADLLPAVINSIYAAPDLAQAAHFLRRGLSAAFGVRESQIWLRPLHEDHLALVGPAGFNLEGDALVESRMAVTADRLEARALRQRVPLRGQEGERQVVRAIPLMFPGDKPIGVATIYDDLLEDLFSEQRERDLQLVGFLNQAARALQTVNTRRQELALAGRMQASLMPVAPPALPGWGSAAVWKPVRETSGDFYDFISLPDGRWVLVIADVVDKGMGAALLMALTRTLVRTYVYEYADDPQGLLDIVNQRIIADIGGSLFVTMFYGILEPDTGKLIYCNAGHPPPFIITHDKVHPVETLLATGMPLGISEDNRWGCAAAEVPEGALLFLYTDGVLDAQNPRGEYFGQEQMLEVVWGYQGRPARAALDGLIAEVYAFAGAEPQVDDITLMLLQRRDESI